MGVFAWVILFAVSALLATAAQYLLFRHEMMTFGGWTRRPCCWSGSTKSSTSRRRPWSAPGDCFPTWSPSYCRTRATRFPWSSHAS